MNLPNYLTLFRILLIPVFFTLLVTSGHGQDGRVFWALIVFVIASLTDALDGLIARLAHQRTTLGTFLDPIADKLLLLSGYLGIIFVSNLPYQPPRWITAAIVLREFVIVVGIIVIYAVTRKVTAVEPHWTGKVTTFFQMTGLIAILLKYSLAIWLWYMTAVFTIFSGAVYVHRGIRALQKGTL